MNRRLLLGLILCTLFSHLFAQTSGGVNVVGTNFQIQSQILGDERGIQVFFPDGYADSERTYPVLYVLDGQRYFLHAVSLQKSFVEFGQAPEFIVVGISKNPTDRNRNYSVNSQNYLDFIENEVMGLVDSKFRTSEQQLLFGWAYAGGFVVQCLITKPDLFDVYIAASPFPLEGKIASIDSLLTEKTDLNKTLYFTSGTKEGMVKEGTHQLNALLSKRDPKVMNWTFRELAGEEHRSTPFTTLYHGVKEAFPYFPELQFTKLEDFKEAGGLPYVYGYYQERALRYGFPKELSDWTMFSLTRNAIRANDFESFDSLIKEFQGTGFVGRLRVNRACSIAEFYLKNEWHEKAEELFTLLVEVHPNSERPLRGLGDAYKGLEMDEKAAYFYNKAEELAGNK